MRSDSLPELDATMARVGHRKCGFVIYRGIYGPGSDDAFSRYLKCLKVGTAKRITEYYDSHPLFEKLEWTVFADREKLEDATKAQIKAHFDEWCRSDIAAAEQPSSLHRVRQSPLARYQFCLYVDQTRHRWIPRSLKPHKHQLL